jgi:small subunit ribosomal protein S8
MALNDTIADFLTRIRNASTARHRYVDVRWSRLVQNIAQILQDEGFVAHYLVKEEDGKSMMRVFLRYTETRDPLIRGIVKVSNPGARKYTGYDEIPRVFNGLGIAILTTSKGVLVGTEARKKKVGGELLCYVW